MSRPRKLSRTEQAVAVMRYRVYRSNSPKRICAELGISPKTLHHYVRSVVPVDSMWFEESEA